MNKIKSHPVPGLCALCCHDVITAEWVAVMGGEDGEHEIPVGTQYDVLQDMASGEWPVHEIKINEGEIKRMTAVSYVAGTVVCTDHIGQVLRTVGLVKPGGVIDAGSVKYVIEGVDPKDLV